MTQMHKAKHRGPVPRFEVEQIEARTVDSIPREEGDVYWVQDPLFTSLRDRGFVKLYEPPAPVEVVQEDAGPPLSKKTKKAK